MADEKFKIGPTFIHGNASNQQIDSAGEIVDLAGLDCGSLLQGSFNFEHKSDVPAQIVGKILEYKKIFSEADCENEHHKHFWDKCKVPYLYVMGRLFDDKKDSSRELAALFQDDAEHPNEPPMVGFSVEGSKISKTGITVDKSIARKITCTNMPCNKACVAEIVKNPDVKADTDEDSIFKSEPSHTIELLEKYEPLSKREVPGSKIPPAHAEPTPSKAIKGAPGWSHKGGGNFHHPEHGIVSVIKQGPEYHVKHGGALAGVGGKKGVFGSAKEAGAHAGEYIRSLGQGKTVAPSMKDRPSPAMKSELKKDMNMSMPPPEPNKANAAAMQAGALSGPTSPSQAWSNIKTGLGFGKKEDSKKPLKKALSAGSGMAAPGSLVQGAALAPESLDRKMKKALWFRKAEEAYSLWEKREQFENFMAKHMPSLTKGEIQVIGATLALRKSLRAEAKLKKMMRDEGQDSWVKKKEK